MEAKFTPGPWEFSAPTMAGSERVVVEAYGFGSIAAISLNGAPRHQSRLQATSPYHQGQIETMNANANLIKASPLLYEALEAVEWISSHGFTFCPCCNHTKQAGHALDCALNTALRAARGEK